MNAIVAELSVVQYALIAGAALLASVIGGIAGYGTGLLLPLILVPLVGAEPVVPIMAIAAFLINASRVAAFRAAIDWRRTMHFASALPERPCARHRWW